MVRAVMPTNENVLIVDDDNFICSSLSKQLDFLGFKDIKIANDGDEGQNLIRTNEHFGIIFVDLNMPKIDGVEFIRYLSDQQFSGAIILMSGVDFRLLQSASNLAQAHSLNFLGALSKPITINQLKLILLKVHEIEEVLEDVSSEIKPKDIFQAIKSQNLKNRYQPVIDLKSNQVIGVESICHLDLGDGILVSSSAIKDIVSDAGLSQEIDRFNFTNALKDTTPALKEKEPLEISINFSMQSLQDIKIVDFILANCQENEVNPGQIRIEVDESRLLHDFKTGLEVFARLSLKSLQFSVNNFGTGFSSLDYLQQIPFKGLKIGRDFIRNASADPTKIAIIETSKNLARNLNFKSIASGVSSLEDWLLIKDKSIDLAQGKFIASPMQFDDFVEWRKLWNESR